MSENINNEVNNEVENEVNDNLIELTDEETGEKIVFELLDTITKDDVAYFVLTEFVEEETETNDVYVMTVVTDENGEETLELVEDDNIVDAVFKEFKEHFGDEFDFLD